MFQAAKTLLYSGGLDSSCAWWMLGKPAALYVGGIHGPARWANVGELQAMNQQRLICPEFAGALRQKPLDFRPFMRHGEYMLPRDEICMAAAWAEGFDEMFLAWTREDCPPGRAAEICARIAGGFPFPFKVTMPFVELSKAELVKAAMGAGAPPEFILASHSCVRGSAHCGQCKNCRQRQEALSACKLV